MRLTRQSSYAVRIVVECALAGDELTRISDIAGRYGITKNNVAKIVPLLVRNGIIRAVRGRSGGIRLARPATSITVGEIVRVSEATMAGESMEDDSDGLGADAAMPIGRLLDDALEAFISVLDGYTVADLAEGRKQGARDRAGDPLLTLPDKKRKGITARRHST